MVKLITDRTLNDVLRWEYLRSKGYDSMTPAERAEWNSNLKGSYNKSDHGRVNAYVRMLADLLEQNGYASDIIRLYDRYLGEILSREYIDAYIQNIKRLRSFPRYNISEGMLSVVGTATVGDAVLGYTSTGSGETFSTVGCAVVGMAEVGSYAPGYDVYYYYADIPPRSVENLDYIGANAIENICGKAYNIINETHKSADLKQSGTLFAIANGII